MNLNLREIISVPGARLPFSLTLPADALQYPSLLRFNSPPAAEGEITNRAGALTIEGKLTADLTLLCDRCGAEYLCRKVIPLSVPLAAELIDDENPDIFPLDGDEADMTLILGTVFLLEADQKSLCKPDCRGLCPTCGKNLNDGGCDCAPAIDPRLAALQQLLTPEVPHHGSPKK